MAPSGDGFTHEPATSEPGWEPQQPREQFHPHSESPTDATKVDPVFSGAAAPFDLERAQATANALGMGELGLDARTDTGGVGDGSSNPPVNPNPGSGGAGGAGTPPPTSDGAGDGDAAGSPPPSLDTRATAAEGLDGASEPLPLLDRIQPAFGKHDVTGVEAQVGGKAEVAATEIGAEAFAVGNRAAFAKTPDLHTATEEAAHIVQQRAGVALPGGVGSEGDSYEQHADRVADAVVAGKSAEPILDEMVPVAGSSTGAAAPVLQLKPADTRGANAALYLNLNAHDAAGEIGRHLLTLSLPSPHPRMPWHDIGAFQQMLLASFDGLVGTFHEPPRLLALVHPADPYAVVDEMRPIIGAEKATEGN